MKEYSCNDTTCEIIDDYFLLICEMKTLSVFASLKKPHNKAYIS